MFLSGEVLGSKNEMRCAFLPSQAVGTVWTAGQTGPVMTRAMASDCEHAAWGCEGGEL